MSEEPNLLTDASGSAARASLAEQKFVEATKGNDDGLVLETLEAWRACLPPLDNDVEARVALARKRSAARAEAPPPAIVVPDLSPPERSASPPPVEKTPQRGPGADEGPRYPSFAVPQAMLDLCQRLQPQPTAAIELLASLVAYLAAQPKDFATAIREIDRLGPD